MTFQSWFSGNRFERVILDYDADCLQNLPIFRAVRPKNKMASNGSPDNPSWQHSEQIYQDLV
jgi:hypothetical protein